MKGRNTVYWLWSTNRIFFLKRRENIAEEDSADPAGPAACMAVESALLDTPALLPSKEEESDKSEGTGDGNSILETADCVSIFCLQKLKSKIQQLVSSPS